MRNRFFFIILSTLVVAALGINLVQVYFFQHQKLKLIDRQLADASIALAESEEFNRAALKQEQITETISKVLKGSRIGKVFALRSHDGKVIFQSVNVNLLGTELPLTPDWGTIVTPTEYVKVRNIQLKGLHAPTLQVGIVIDQNVLNWRILDKEVVFYISGIVIAVFLCSIFLTHFLLEPVRLLNSHLNQETAHLVNLRDVKPLPKKLTSFGRSFWAASDEFSNLVGTIQKLIDRINLNYKLTRSWTQQMAHELKTPLTILRANVESKNKAKLLPESYTKETIAEIQHMTKIINQFLDWAEIENSSQQKDIHALKMSSLLGKAIERLSKVSPDRILLQIDTDFAVFANPVHIDLLISNLITNALKFSPPSSKVILQTSQQSITVKDTGPGIPQDVLERLGQPFNIGAQSSTDKISGTGLGLAWVTSVSKIYNWQLHIQSNAKGTHFTVQFPLES